MTKVKNYLLLIALSMPIVTIGVFFTSNNTAAVSGSSWKAGNIINDAMFTNSNSMSVSQIQSFLNNKVGTGAYGTTGVCDTYGTKTSELGGGTRAQYGAAHNNPSPFTCLKDYYEVPKTSPSADIPANNYGGKSIPTGAKSSAQIIWDAAQKYNINPQVLLVKLGTESAGPLTSDDWPFFSQYKYAMGSHCPDSGPNGSANCDVNYSGLSMQMDSAASLLRWYLDNMEQSWWSYKKPYQTNYILWNVSQTGCGGGDVYIENKATAALYTYTPYQPNSAAINNMYGTGDSCSAYGNRNFWRTFNDWFGSSQAANGNIQLSSDISVTTSSGGDTIYQGDTVSVSYNVSNTASYDTRAGGLGVCARINGKYYDFGFNDNVNIAANSQITINYSKTINESGNLNIFECSYSDTVGGWASGFYPYSVNQQTRAVTKTVQANPVIISNVEFDNTTFVVGEPIEASFMIKNNSPISINIGTIVIAARDPDGKNVDFPVELNININANSTFEYRKTINPNKIGKYSYFIANYKDGSWSSTYPSATSSDIIRSGSFEVKDNPLITSGLSISPLNPAQGQTVTATFSIKNCSSNPVNLGMIFAAARDSHGNNLDFPADTNVVVAANSTYTYSKQRTFNTIDSFTVFIINYHDNIWDRNSPKSFDNSINRNASFSTRENPVVTSNLSISPSNPVIGDTIAASFSIRNDSNSPVNIGMILVAARDPNGNNIDFPAEVNLIIPANSTFTYSKTRIASMAGKYSLFIANYNNSTWSGQYPKSLTPSIVRSQIINVTNNPIITSGISISPDLATINSNVTASVTVKNNSNNSVNIGLFVIAARDPLGRNVDFPADNETIIPAGSTLIISKTRTFTTSGQYNFFLASYRNNAWSTNYPNSSDSSIIRSLTKTIH